MRSEWREVRLEDYAKFQEGYVNPSQSEPSFFDGNIKWLRASDINNAFVYDTERRLSKEGYLSAGASAKLFEPETLVISKSGTIGRVGILKDYMAGNRATINIMPANNINRDFLFYTLLNEQHQIQSLAVGSVQRNLYVSNLQRLRLLLPPLPTQKAIAATLSCLDAKIEVNNNIIKNLEKQARAIFKRWFIDFEPFQEGKFVESELGMIPEGWRVGTLGEIIKITSGKRPNARQESEDNRFRYPLHGASGIMGYTTEYLYDEKIIVIGRVGTHGIVQEIEKACWPSDNTLVIKSMHYGFTALILKLIDYKVLNRGSTQPLITQTDIKNTKIAIPPKEYINRYEKIYNFLFKKRRILNSQNTTLSSLRDTLLPKLMSGEVQVPLDH